MYENWINGGKASSNTRSIFQDQSNPIWNQIPVPPRRSVHDKTPLPKPLLKKLARERMESQRMITVTRKKLHTEEWRSPDFNDIAGSLIPRQASRPTNQPGTNIVPEICGYQAASLAKPLFILQPDLTENRFIQRQLIDWVLGRVTHSNNICQKCKSGLSRDHAIACSGARALLQQLSPLLDIYSPESLSLQGNLISTYIRTFAWINWKSRHVKMPDHFLLPMDQLGMELEGLELMHFPDHDLDDWYILAQRFTRRALYLLAESIVLIKQKCMGAEIAMPRIELPNTLLPELDPSDVADLHQHLLTN